MNAMKNLAHLIVLGVLAVAGVLFSLKVLFAGGLVAALLFWAWFAGYAALTSWVTSGFKSPLGALACLYVMWWLPRTAWIRFGIWMLIGVVFYFAYGFKNSRLAQRRSP